LAGALDTARVEPFAELREELLAVPFAEPALFLEMLLAELRAGAFAAGFPLAVPVALTFPADFGTAFVFPCS
jgi:hypothetical protein